jgi:hypothetical protein
MNAIVDRFYLFVAWLRRQAISHLTLLGIFLPVGLLAAALAGYGWWWQVVADGMRSNVLGFQSEQIALGREVTWDAFNVRGFPYRVEGALSTLRLTAPDRGSAYDGERIVVHVEPFALNRIALSLEGQHHVFYARERWIDVTARADKSLVTLSGEGDAHRINLDIERLTGKLKLDEKDINVIVEAARSGLTVTDPNEREPLPRVDLLARLRNVALQGNLDLPLGSSIAWLDMDVGAKLPANIAQTPTTSLIAAWQQTNTPVEIRRFELEWGGVSVAASGELKLDAQSLPEGRLRLTLGNHPRILELLREHGLITPETETTARKVLDVLAFMSGDAQRRVSVPLRFEQGNVYLGPARVAKLTPEPASAQLMPTMDAAPLP